MKIPLPLKRASQHDRALFYCKENGESMTRHSMRNEPSRTPKLAKQRAVAVEATMQVNDTGIPCHILVRRQSFVAVTGTEVFLSLPPRLFFEPNTSPPHKLSGRNLALAEAALSLERNLIANTHIFPLRKN